MEDKTKLEIETEEFLAKIRKTIAESDRLVSQAELRIAETDRMLEKQGLTREQVMGMRFTDEQREMVNRELVRQGMEPLEEDDVDYISRRDAETQRDYGYLYDSATSQEGKNTELAERQRKFCMMMKPFQI